VTFEPNRPANQQPADPFQPVAPQPAAVPTTPVTPAPVTSAALPGPARKASSGGRWLNTVLVVAAAVAIGGIAFAIGRGTAPASATTGNGPVFESGAFPGGSFAPGASGAPGLVRGFGGGFGGGPTIEGTVESVDGDTLTIKTKNGQTIKVSTGASTTYHAQTDASASDVQPGKTVQVQLDGGITGRPNASAAAAAPVGTAGSVTVIP
jgi:hypothetical protein